MALLATVALAPGRDDRLSGGAVGGDYDDVRPAGLVILLGFTVALSGCISLPVFEYHVTDAELTSELGRKSIRYQQVEQLVSADRYNETVPGVTNLEIDIERALRRQELLGVPRGKLDRAVRRAARRLVAMERFAPRFRRARDLLDRCDLEVYPDEEYALIDGEKFVRRWNRLIDAEHQIIAVVRRLSLRRLRRERRFVAAARAGQREHAEGGGRRFLAAARRWRLYDDEVDALESDERLERPFQRWDKAHDRLVEVHEGETDVSGLVSEIKERYPRSFFAKDEAFLTL